MHGLENSCARYSFIANFGGFVFCELKYTMGRYSRIMSDEIMANILSDFDRLRGRCYLDNAGAAMFPKSLLHSINEDLINNIYLNPHSDKFTADCIDQVRFKILKHFNSNSDDYTVIFTSGSTASLKMVAESFDFDKGLHNSADKKGALAYLSDNHTSVLGMREIAKQKGADVIVVSHQDFLNLGSDNPQRTDYIDENALFVYPAQNNFNGFKYPLRIIDNLRNGCLNEYASQKVGKGYKNWYVMSDSACYVSTNRLDLSEYRPDFVCISFYKIFGFPTGLGALLVKNDSAHVLNQKMYFGGGTVDIVLSTEDFHVKRKNLRERFEDGTLSFLSILSLNHCFDTLNRIIPKLIRNDSMSTVSYHTFYLAKDLYEQLERLRHTNGSRAAILYSDSDFSDPEKQGGVVAFNMLRSDGSYIGYAEFQHMANLFNISLRTGCFCNNGSCQRHLKLSTDDIKAGYNAGHVCGDEMDLFQGKPTGCIRASFGYYNTYQDVDTLMLMICKCFIETDYIAPDRSMLNGFHSEINDNDEKLYKKGALPNGHVTFNENENHVNGDTKCRLEDIALFPIKSCAAYKPFRSWRIGPKGLEYDREWMIIRDNGTCLTQKQCTSMCMIRPTLDFERGLLILSFPGMSSISVSLERPIQKKGFHALLCQSKVCNDSIEGYDCGEEVGEWISEALGVSFLRLIRQCNTDKRIKKRSVEQPNLLSLSNQAQYLLINKSTVKWLAREIKDDSFDENIDGLLDRFRGNLIVDTGEELVERDWRKVVIGKHEFKVEGPCARCQMVCINQHSGEKTVEPLRTISKLFAGKMRFGIYLTYVGTTDQSNDRLIYTRSALVANNDAFIS